MREGWEYKRLGEVATFVNGYAFKPNQWKESGYPIVRIQNLNNPNAPYNYFDGEVPDNVRIQNGDLLISWSASLGVYIWDSGKALLNQHIFKVVFDKMDIDKFFLKYAVTSKLETMAGQVHGATMKHIVKKDFDNTLIPCPPKSTQQLIVAELDKINELIRLKKEQLEDYDRLAQSIFYDMFGDPVENEKGWERKVMPELCDIIDGDRGKNYPKQEEFTSSGYCLFLNAKNVTKTGFDFSMCSFITKEKDEIMRKGKLQRGDLVLTTRGTIGNIAIYNSDVKYNNVRINSGMVILRLNHYIDKTMFEKQFKLHLSSIKQKIASGSAQPQLPISSMKKIKMIIPPLPLQHLFAQRIEQIERQKEEVKKAITDLETLLASRMQYWFE